MKIVMNPIRDVLCEAQQDFHLLIRLQSDSWVAAERTPINLALVIDRSSSIHGNNLTEVKHAIATLLARMAPTDRIGLVQFDDTIDIIDKLMPLTSVIHAKDVIQPMVRNITAGGSTNMHAGWLRACEMLAPHAGPNSVCRVLLLSDGLANANLTEPSRIGHQLAALARSGVTTTTIGLGIDFNEGLMTHMAKAGQGNAHYCERAIDLTEAFDAEISEISDLQWRDIDMTTIHRPAGMEMLNDYESTGNGWRLPAVGSGSECWASLRIPMNEALRAQREHGSVLSIQVQTTDCRGERQTFNCALPLLPEVQAADFDERPIHDLVLRRVTELAAAQLNVQIREAALQGNWEQVQHLLAQLESLGRHEPWVAGSIAFTRHLVLERDARRISLEMLYKARRMHRRISSTNEITFGIESCFDTPTFLRRKLIEGRRTERLTLSNLGSEYAPTF